MSSSTTSAPSRQPLVEVFRDVADPGDRRGARHDPPTILSPVVMGILAGCESLTAIWGRTTDLETTELEALGLEEGRALSSAVHYPQGPAGPGPSGPRRPPDILVLHAHRRHRGKNSDRGGG